MDKRNNSNRLLGKTAFITGGNSGIGLATAQLFAKEGAKLVITGRDQATLEEAAASIHGEVLTIQSDVSATSDIQHAFETAKAAYGGIDILFANAGVGKFAPIELTTEAIYDEMMDVNVKGVYFTVQKAIPFLHKNASIILSGSFLSQVGVPNTSVLSATKAAVSSLGKSLAAELVQQGFRVNTLSPGYIATPFASRAGLPEDALHNLVQSALDATPLHRFGKPEEMAKTALFLASDDSSYLVGSEILADGGVVNA
ncbi:MAG: SDR family oxidoreductase [Saprospiraceae bacterium]|nr:SDR family oxidoreductase [Saprospiraceae bacterium]